MLLPRGAKSLKSDGAWFSMMMMRSVQLLALAVVGLFLFLLQQSGYFARESRTTLRNGKLTKARVHTHHISQLAATRSNDETLVSSASLEDITYCTHYMHEHRSLAPFSCTCVPSHKLVSALFRLC